VAGPGNQEMKITDGNIKIIEVKLITQGGYALQTLITARY